MNEIVETPEPVNSAAWKVELNTDCPDCHQFVDLLDDPEFFSNRPGLIAGETGSERSIGMEVSCPNCGHEFTVDLEY